MLDEEHGGALFPHGLDVAEEALLQGWVHARHRLVEHDEFRIRHECASHLEQFALATRQRPGEIPDLLVQVEPLQQPHGLLADRLLLGIPQEGQDGCEEAFTGLVLGAEPHVVDNGHAAEGLGQLEGSHHADSRQLVRGGPGNLAVVERPGAFVSVVESGDQVEERGLTSAVGSDEGSDRPTLNLDVFHVHRCEAAKGPTNVVGDHDGVGLGHAGAGFHGGERGAGGRSYRVRDCLVIWHRAPTPFCLRRCPEAGRPSRRSVPSPSERSGYCRRRLAGGSRSIRPGWPVRGTRPCRPG